MFSLVTCYPQKKLSLVTSRLVPSFSSPEQRLLLCHLHLGSRLKAVMSYYGNSNNNWNRRPISEEVDIGSGQYPPPSSDERFSTRPAQPPGFGQQQQQPGQWGVPQQPGFGRNNAYAKNYNDFLERQGIPTINPEDLQILQECGRESLYFRCKYKWHFSLNTAHVSVASGDTFASAV